MVLEEVSVFIVLFLSQDVSGPLHKQLLPRWSLDLWWACLGEWLPLSEDSVSMVICRGLTWESLLQALVRSGWVYKENRFQTYDKGNKGPQHSELVCDPLDFNVYLPGMKGEIVEEKSLGFHFYRNFQNKIKKALFSSKVEFVSSFFPNKTKQNKAR